MPYYLPNNVIYRSIVWLSASKPIPSIATAIGVAKETIYYMEYNIKLWDVLYPLPTVKLSHL